MSDGKLTLEEFAKRSRMNGDYDHIADALQYQPLMNKLLYADDKPSTRWSRFVYRLKCYRNRVRNAWDVLRGRAFVDD